MILINYQFVMIKFTKNLERVWQWFWKVLVIKIIKPNIELIVSIVALYIAVKSMNNANSQFKQNRIDSEITFKYQQEKNDSLFNQQIAKNDSLIKQIIKLQEITDNQLKNSKSQLKLSRLLYEEKIIEGFPYFQIVDIRISNIVYNNDSSTYSPLLTIVLENSGSRYAYDVNSYIYASYNNFTSLRSAKNSSDIKKVPPHSNYLLIFAPIISIEYKNDFYFAFETNYIDLKTKKDYHQAYYFHASILRNELQFVATTLEETELFRNRINLYNKKNNLPPFDQQPE